MAKPKFCDPENLSVLIPYSDLQKIMDMATNIEAMSAQYKHMSDQVVALRGMYFEALEKIAEINRYL